MFKDLEEQQYYDDLLLREIPAGTILRWDSKLKKIVPFLEHGPGEHSDTCECDMESDRERDINITNERPF